MIVFFSFQHVDICQIAKYKQSKFRIEYSIVLLQRDKTKQLVGYSTLPVTMEQVFPVSRLEINKLFDKTSPEFVCIIEKNRQFKIKFISITMFCNLYPPLWWPVKQGLPLLQSPADKVEYSRWETLSSVSK